MSYRSPSHQPHSDRLAHGHDHGEDRHADHPARDPGAHAYDHRGHHGLDDRRRRPDGEPKRPTRKPARQAQDYTLGHAGRQVRLAPVAFWTIVGTLVIMGGWSIMTATYFAFHDDVITRLIARQAEMQFAYEDRIAEMRAQVDRVTSRQLLDQEQVEQKLELIQRRQATLESRAAALGAVSDPGVTGSIKPGARGPLAEPSPAQPRKPSPISGTTILTAPADRQARLAPTTRSAKATAGGIEAVLARVQSSLDRVETRQVTSLGAMEESYASKTHRIRSALADLGLDLGKATEDARGGPFVPYKLASHATTFDRQLHRISVARAQLERLNKTLVTVPIRKPVAGEIDTSSGFGVRIDPFLGRPAMHTGLDFRGNSGEAIRATAGGTVVSAGWSGGYGKLVEIDHGHGLSTRYGHLSEIDVRAGQTVKTGQVVGRLGSTGRSTGPHLHYETRLEGDAVDPQKFLRAGTRLGAL